MHDTDGALETRAPGIGPAHEGVRPSVRPLERDPSPPSDIARPVVFVCEAGRPCAIPNFRRGPHVVRTCKLVVRVWSAGTQALCSTGPWTKTETEQPTMTDTNHNPDAVSMSELIGVVPADIGPCPEWRHRRRCIEIGRIVHESERMSGMVLAE